MYLAHLIFFALVVVPVHVRSVTFRQVFITPNAHAILKVPTLHALFTLTVLIYVAVDALAPVHGDLPFISLSFDPLSG